MNEESPIIEGTDETTLDDNTLLCLLTGEAKKDTGKERNLQSIIRMLNEEYGFELSDMYRDFTVSGTTASGGKWKRRMELIVLAPGAGEHQKNIIRLCVIQDEKVKENDLKNGVQPTLETALLHCDNCEFGLWTNGISMHFLQKEEDEYGNPAYADLSDFPGAGESLDDLERDDRSGARTPANDSLIRTFRYCHDYIYGNEGMKKTAFWELLNLIFCKIYDEKRRTLPDPKGKSYHRKFWVGVKERNTPEGLAAIAGRIKELFDDLKTHPLFSEVFEGNEKISLTDKGLAFVAAELAKYNFLDASVDVKGMAYETIVGNTFKKEDGQFFTPRNIVRCMVEMLDPEPHHRVLDPACGSGGFLVMVLDHVRRKIAKQKYPDAEGVWLNYYANSDAVNEDVRQFAGQYIFGLDFDPDLKKAARMNMVMAGDGHANIFHLNSLAYPFADNTAELDKLNEAVNRSTKESPDRNFPFEYEDARGKFDIIFTNPPFGAKIPINDQAILRKFDLGHRWKRNGDQWERTEALSSSEPPEILFLDACCQLLKPGGRMAIVLPDGILGNPNTEYVRYWVLQNFRILASVDLPVEAFLPQVGVQASLLFLQKKTDAQRTANLHHTEDYDVFMAIAEKVGKDRRGVPVYERDEDGAELFFSISKDLLRFDKKGKPYVVTRTAKEKQVDDDLPKITKAYLEFLQSHIA